MKLKEKRPLGQISPRVKQRAPYLLTGIIPILLLILALAFFQANNANAASTNLTVEVLASYNLIVDSNATAASTAAPNVATVSGKFCNTGGSSMTNVMGYIGDYVPGTPANSTPGTFPVRATTDTDFTTYHPTLNDTGGDYHFTLLGETSEASRFIGTLGAGECSVQYWHFTYPQCETVGGSDQSPQCTNQAAWGASVKADDDLWLQFDIWADADEFTLGGETVVDYSSGTDARTIAAKQSIQAENGDDNASTWVMYMRNEISAMANKIQPHPDGIWFNTNPGDIRPGNVITSNGVKYEFGNIRFGFDNDGNYSPDYNAWAQPIGDASYDPSCFRLLRTTTTLTVSRSAGNPDMIIGPVANQLYFSDLPSDNTGVRGVVQYAFLALGGVCSMPLSPYQEVASGYDNEKFNGDYGVGGPPFISSDLELTFSKTGDATTTEGGTINYSIPFANASGTSSLGLVLSSGYGVNMPLVISDTIPAGLQYVCGSAAMSPGTLGYNLVTSVDGGATWQQGEPASCPPPSTATVILQWWLTDELAASSGGTAAYSASVPSNYLVSGNPIVENTACAQLGDATTTLACDNAYTRIQGSLNIGDTVYEDDGGTTGSYGNRVQDGDEGIISGVTTNLYYDFDGDGKFDSAKDILWATTTTDSTNNPGENYLFNNLPAGKFFVEVDVNTLPVANTGWALTTVPTYTVNLIATDVLTADFGFAPPLEVTKDIIGGGPLYENQEVQYRITVENRIPGSGVPGDNSCIYTVYASIAHQDNTLVPNGGGPTNAQWQSVGSALGVPDSAYAFTDMNDNTDLMGLSGFDVAGQGVGNITTVEAIFYATEITEFAVGDAFEFNVYANDIDVNGASALGSYDDTYFTQPLGESYTIIQDIMGAIAPASWTWADFLTANYYEMQVIGNKSGGSPGDVGLDAAAYRITTDGSCPSTPSNILSPVPLTDTYDPTKLTYLSSEPPADDTGTPGTLEWNDVGPLYPGQKKSILVTFEALAPVGNPDSVDNTATVDSAKYADGRDANDDSDVETVDLYPTGSLAGVVWAEGATGSTGWVNIVGYETLGSVDYPIASVTVTLQVCREENGDFIDPNIYAGTNQTCNQATGAGGGWFDYAVLTTDANGAYLFDGLLDAYYRTVVNPSGIPGNGSGSFTQTGDPNDTMPSPSQCTTGGSATCDDQSNEGSDSLETSSGTEILGRILSANDVTDINYGYAIPPAIYGNVWQDHDGDGNQDSGDNGIPNITVYLYQSDCSTLVNTTTTDSNGDYLFDQTSGGADLSTATQYCVVSDTTTLPNDPGTDSWTETSELRSDDTSDATPTDSQMITFATVGGNVDGGYDFGYTHTGDSSIGDTLYFDWDGDGVEDAIDDGIPDITVYLYEDKDGDGIIDTDDDALVATTSTDPSGMYLFGNLPAGNYIVKVELTDTEFPTYVAQTGDPDETGICTVCDSKSTTSVLGNGDSDLTQDFGYQPTGTGSIGDFVWFDQNGDGVQDGGLEAGIENITIDLWADPDGDGTYTLIKTTTTDADGNYLFEDLPPMDYRVIVNSADPDLPNDARGNAYIPSTSVSIDRTLAVGETYLAADFGFTANGSVGDYIWQDSNADGNQDPTEPGISGVTVQLCTFAYTDSNANGRWDYGEATGAETGCTTTTTDGSGFYLFDNLSDGPYVVRVPSAPNGWQQTGDPDLSTVCSGGTCDGESHLHLNQGQTDFSRDFGYAPPIIIGDTVWIDSNGNGVVDGGESGIPNITVYMCATAYASPCGSVPAEIIAQTTTDIDGKYYFSGTTTDFPDGSYVVAVDRDDSDFPTGLTQTYGPGIDGVNPDSTTDIATVVIGGAGTTFGVGGDAACAVPCNLNADFGYQGNLDLSGYVFYDSNASGGDRLDGASAETGFAGVTIYLYQDADNNDIADAYIGSTNTVGEIVNGRLDVNGDGTVDTSDDGWYFGYEFIDGQIDLNGDGSIDTVGTTDNGTFSYDDDGSPLTIAVVQGQFDINGSGAVLTDGTDDSIALQGRYEFLNLADSTFIATTNKDQIPLSGLNHTTNPSNNDGTAYELVTMGSANQIHVDFGFSTNLDFGDLPDSYHTTSNNNGARHIVGGSLYLGSSTSADTDINGQENAGVLDGTGDDVDADGDDEDGVNVVMGNDWGDVDGGQLTYSVTGSGCLIGWADWNDNGSFDTGLSGGKSELIINQFITTGGPVTYNVDSPLSTFYGGGYTYPGSLSLRFRLFPPNDARFASLPVDGDGCPTAASANSLFVLHYGQASDGEVEDYIWPFESPTAVSMQNIQANNSNVLALVLFMVVAMFAGTGMMILNRRRVRIER